jgi:hypothetical protein
MMNRDDRPAVASTASNRNEEKTIAETWARGPGIDPRRVRPGMRVVCADESRFAVVDHMHGRVTIKLERDEHGAHHFIPLAWVMRIDDEIHIDRARDQAMREWSTEQPTLP